MFFITSLSPVAGGGLGWRVNEYFASAANTTYTVTLVWKANHYPTGTI
jgi:predicted alpha-1,6-mannanase (GH76 family)